MTQKRKADLTVRVERDLLEEMRRAALRDDRSMNSFMIAAIRRQLNELGIKTTEQTAQKRGGKRK